MRKNQTISDKIKSKNPKKNIIIWDYDGTIADTEALYHGFLTEYFREKGLLLGEMSSEYFAENVAGTYSKDFLNKLINDGYIKKTEITPEKLDADIKKSYTEFFSKLPQEALKITEGTLEIITQLKQDPNNIMCIATSSMPEDFRIKHTNINNECLNSIFKIGENIYSFEVGKTECKPSPSIFLSAQERTMKINNLSNENIGKIIIIEDSVVGCKAAFAFKNDKKNKEIKDQIVIIGYLAGTKKTEGADTVLKTAGADMVAKNAEELGKFIGEFIKKTNLTNNDLCL